MEKQIGILQEDNGGKSFPGSDYYEQRHRGVKRRSLVQEGQVVLCG